MAPRFCRPRRCFPFARRPLLCLLEPFFFFLPHFHSSPSWGGASFVFFTSKTGFFRCHCCCWRFMWKNGTADSQGVVFCFFFLTVLWFKALWRQWCGDASEVCFSYSFFGFCLHSGLRKHPYAFCCASKAFRLSKNPQCRWILIQGVFTVNFAWCDHRMAGFSAVVLGGSGGSQPRSGLRTELLWLSQSFEVSCRLKKMFFIRISFICTSRRCSFNFFLILSHQTDYIIIILFKY